MICPGVYIIGTSSKANIPFPHRPSGPPLKATQQLRPHLRQRKLLPLPLPNPRLHQLLLLRNPRPSKNDKKQKHKLETDFRSDSSLDQIPLTNNNLPQYLFFSFYYAASHLPTHVVFDGNPGCGVLIL
jgi:hypothetical protein